MFSLRLVLLAACVPLFAAVSLRAAHPAAEALLVPLELPGERQDTVKWTELSSLNSTRVPASGVGAIRVVSPGFQASAGFYSFSGPYAATIEVAPDFAVGTVVLQIVGMRVSDTNADLDYSVEDHLGFEGGPVLAYTHAGGSGTLAPTSRAAIAGPFAGSGGGFEGDYHSFAWQWDLRALDPSVTITGIGITVPLIGHSSTVGAQLDLGDTYAQIVGEPALAALEAWRQLHFGPPASEADAADTADPDADGLPNLLEYALSRDPLASETGPGLSLAPSPDATRLRLSFARIADPHLRYVVEATGDLSAPAWAPIWTSTGDSNTEGPVTVEDTQLLSASPRRFLRLRIETTTP